MNIDWSKAPEGATHYGATSYFNGSPDWCEAFYKSIGGRWLICFPASDDWHGDASKNRDWDERFATLIARPAVWTGEGLPPVGTVCEVDYCESWQRCEVIAHFRQRCGMVAAFTVDLVDGAKSLDAFGSDEFRPIRTPEQIEAEERQIAVSEMFDDAQVDFSAGDLMSPQEYVRCALAALYDKGYRKEVKP